MISPEIICGIEFELEYNRRLGEIEKYNYHRAEGGGDLGKNFYCESDGSLRVNTFNPGDIAEIITIPFNIKDYKKIAKSFERNIKRKFGIDRRDDNLSKVLSFNNSTGCHIHMTVLKKNRNEVKQISYKDKLIEIKAKTFKFKKLVTYGFLNKLKETIRERVKEELPSVFPDFNDGYDRNYAKPSTEQTFGKNRNADWNLTVRAEDHIEFRAFNLRGVKTWTEFHKMLDIAFNTISDYFGCELNKPEVFDEVRTIDLTINTKRKRRNYDEQIDVYPAKYSLVYEV